MSQVVIISRVHENSLQADKEEGQLFERPCDLAQVDRDPEDQREQRMDDVKLHALSPDLLVGRWRGGLVEVLSLLESLQDYQSEADIRFYGEVGLFGQQADDYQQNSWALKVDAVMHLVDDIFAESYRISNQLYQEQWLSLKSAQRVVPRTVLFFQGAALKF